jgi:hypothetical protein
MCCRGVCIAHARSDLWSPGSFRRYRVERSRAPTEFRFRLFDFYAALRKLSPILKDATPMTGEPDGFGSPVFCMDGSFSRGLRGKNKVAWNDTRSLSPKN